MRQSRPVRRQCASERLRVISMDASDYDLVFPDTVEPAPVPAAVLPPPSPALITRRVMPGTSIRRLRNRSSAWPRRTHDAGKERLRCG